MSNSQVGQIYQQIIADVIETSRTDLEENGVDESILEELQQVSQFPPVVAPASVRSAPFHKQIKEHLLIPCNRLCPLMIISLPLPPVFWDVRCPWLW
jgi:hypothetical protein